MNAYELANKIETSPYAEYISVKKAVIMLRQQADELDKVIPQLVKANGIIENLRIRIAELEKVCQETFVWGTQADKMIRQQADKIAELEKEKKHLTAYVDYFGDEIATPQTKPLSDDVLGAYEYQLQRAKLFKELNHIKETKPLSDEEIDELADKFGAGMEQFGGCFRHLDFARAIETKVKDQ